MMMSHNPPSHPSFENFCDMHSPEANRFSQYHQGPAPFRSPLGHLPTSQSQNCRLGQVHDIGVDIHESTQASRNWNSSVIQKNHKEKRASHRLSRPSLTSDTFQGLDPVIEAESRIQKEPTTSEGSSHAQRVLQLPVDKASNHPLSVAANNIPPLEKQLAKHRDGLFEWILAVQVPSDSKSQRDLVSEVNSPGKTRKVYYGCNLLPSTAPEGKVATSYLLAVTPLTETKDVLEVFRQPIGDPNMVDREKDFGTGTPVEISDHDSVSIADGASLNSIICNRGDNSVESIMPNSPVQPIMRIEDSIEALDMLDDQLEAFNRFTRLDSYISTELEQSPPKRDPANRAKFATTSPSVRFATPPPQRTFTESNSASLPKNPSTEPQTAALRKATSMPFISPKLKVEKETQSRVVPQTSAQIGANKISPPRQDAKSTKQRTVPTYELPGEAVARDLKARKEARLASQRATQPTAASLRRARSIKLPTRSTFELPGEVISRRKREERQAQLKAQEENEKKRREFKARPLPSHTVPASFRRDTISSRARHGKAAHTENSAHAPASQRPYKTTGGHHLAVLTSTINQQHSRGQGLESDGLSIRSSRPTSVSTASGSGGRSLSLTSEVQMRQNSDQGTYRPDYSWTDNRMAEKCSREALAKRAREEAAEKSRQKSREWAAKQARKKRIDGSLRGVGQ
ncbi:hypothetical protein GGS21DRAFT_522732 [Xylaria nigripes]|nr:hypothetical protein GGS21DRAFT_522732 [Xylaria nigripes]